MDGQVLSFTYHRSLAPMMGVLLGLALVEMFVVHIVAVALWRWTVAIALGVIDLSMVVWLVLLIRSFRRLPVTISDGQLTMRAGNLRSIKVPFAAIVGLRDHWDAAALKQPGVVNLALAAWPSVVVDLRAPIAVRRGKLVTAIAHKLDDPAAFRAALLPLLSGATR